jgi:hypothetical protein
LQVAAQVALDNAQGDTANRILKVFEWPGKNGWMDGWMRESKLTAGLAVACTACGCGIRG